MKIGMVVAATAAVFTLTACATKRYPIATTLSPTEAALMTCRELALEQDRVETTRAQISDTAGTDWRSVAGFLGDWGIGNAMAKSDADKALTTRGEAIRYASARRGCNGSAEPVAALPVVPNATPAAAVMPAAAPATP